jgi:predicted DNA-binding protein (MmcQ/YjbR family)
MATAAQFRKLALSQPGAEEGAHMQHADFRAGGKIFASITQDERRASLKLSPEVQAMVTSDPAFEPAAGAWGASGWTSVTLSAVNIGKLHELVAESVRLVSAKKLSLKSAKPALAKAPAAKGSKPGKAKDSSRGLRPASRKGR